MSTFGKIARGLATGLANYEGEVYKSQEEDKKTAILMAREQALASINHQNRIDEITATGRQNRMSSDSAAEAHVWQERQLLPEKTKAQIDVDHAKEQAAYDRWKMQFPAEERAKLTLAKFQASADYNKALMQETHSDARNAADNQTARDTHPILTGEAPDGSPVASFAVGATTRQTTMKGAHFRRTGSSDDDLDFGGGTPSASSVTRPAAPKVAGPDSAFRTAYANASPQQAPGLFRNGQKIPLDEAWNLFQGDQ